MRLRVQTEMMIYSIFCLKMYISLAIRVRQVSQTSCSYILSTTSKTLTRIIRHRLVMRSPVVSLSSLRHYKITVSPSVLQKRETHFLLRSIRSLMMFKWYCRDYLADGFRMFCQCFFLKFQQFYILRTSTRLTGSRSTVFQNNYWFFQLLRLKSSSQNISSFSIISLNFQ